MNIDDFLKVKIILRNREGHEPGRFPEGKDHPTSQGPEVMNIDDI